MPAEPYQQTQKSDQSVLATNQYSWRDTDISYSNLSIADNTNIAARFSVQPGSLNLDIGGFNAQDTESEARYIRSVPFCINEANNLNMSTLTGNLHLTGHRLGFTLPILDKTSPLYTQGKASLRINNGPWINLSDISHQNGDITIDSKAMHFGGVDGGFKTIKIDIAFAKLASVLNGGTNACNNKIDFRFNGTDGISSGYRILDFNLTYANRELIPSAQFEQEDPSAWTIPNATDDAVARGKFLFYRRNLLRENPLEPKRIIASCADCHAHDGRDLQYFAYSSWSIAARARFHGLNQAQGDYIAQYIRSLGDSIKPWGRPWNPPYQPGPGIDSRPSARERFASGAGIDSVLETEASNNYVMAKQLFDTQDLSTLNTDTLLDWLSGFSLTDTEAQVFSRGVVSPSMATNITNATGFNTASINDLAAIAGENPPVKSENPPVVSKGTINIRELPIAIQLPDWNAWLPIIHPLDAFRDPGVNQISGVRHPNFVEAEFYDDLVSQWDIPGMYSLLKFTLLSTSERKRYLENEAKDVVVNFNYTKASGPMDAKVDYYNGTIDTAARSSSAEFFPFVQSRAWAAVWQAHNFLARNQNRDIFINNAGAGANTYSTLTANFGIIDSQINQYISAAHLGDGAAMRNHFGSSIALAEYNGVPKDFARQGLVQWSMVKYWEMMQEYQLEDELPRVFPGKGEVLGWPLGSATSGHLMAPHLLASNEVNYWIEGIYEQPPVQGVYASNIWYHLQILLNAGNRQQTGLVDVRPDDWEYYYAHVNNLSQILPEYMGDKFNPNYLEPLRYIATITKGLQMRDIGIGPVGGGYRLRYIKPWRFIATDNRTSYNDKLDILLQALNNRVPAEANDLRKNFAEAALHYFDNKAQYFWINNLRGETNANMVWQFCKDNNNWICLTPRTPMDATIRVSPDKEPLFFGGGDNHAQVFYNMLRLMNELNMDQKIINNFHDFQQSVWGDANPGFY